MYGDVEIVTLGLVMNFTTAEAFLIQGDEKKEIKTTLTKVNYEYLFYALISQNHIVFLLSKFVLI